jgi:hypothetical protein
MKKFLLFFFIITFYNLSFAGVVSGKITDENNQTLPFVSVYIKNTTTGTTANADGYYTISLSQGTYTLCFKIIGYKLFTKEITVNGDLTIDARLFPESFSLNEVEIKAGGEDPAYAIIRAAIKKRKYYQEQVDAYSCDVYIKGVQRIMKSPKKIMGEDVDFGIIDTATGIVYLSESVSKFNFKQKNKIKEVMISSKVSGENNAFSYNQASDMLFNFYENTLEMDDLSERGFISPISQNAMFSYRYKLLGIFYENGQRINQIQVIPKRKNDPVFSGTINIMEDSWRIHSLQLVLTKDAQIDFVDTLRIDQLYIPVEKDVWLLFSNKFTFDFSVKLFKLKGSGMYVGVNSNYIMSPDFPKHFFTAEVLKINDDANKKDSSYWKESRPVPLTIEEITDYRKRDSINAIKNSKAYKDSVDRKSNKLKIQDLILGYTYRNSFKKSYLSIRSPLLGLQYNTVQGGNLSMGVDYYKYNENNKNYDFGIIAGYGYSNKDAYGSAFADYVYKPQKFAKISCSFGKEYTQFNSNAPIKPLINTFYSLLNEQNFMKLYVKTYAKITHSSELINGLYFTPSIEYADRYSLVNTSNYTWNNTERSYTSNNPLDTSAHGYFFPHNQSLSIDFKIRYVFKQRYYTSPNLKTVIGSKFPTLLAGYKKGINALGSDVNYDLVTVGVKHTLNLKFLGNSTYTIIAGSFINNKKMYFMDWYHFNGNQTLFSGFGLSDFQLLNYYTNSTNKQFVEGHFEHNFGGFFLTKIPLLKKLKLQEIGKIGFLTNDWANQYIELSAGIKRLYFRADYVTGYSNQQKVYSGIRIGILLSELKGE